MMEDNQIDQNVDLIFTKEDAFRMLEMINTWISNIDTKVSFALALSGVLIGSVFSTGLPNALQRISEVSKLKELNGGEIIGAILVCILYVVSFISILYFMLAIIARIKNPNNFQSILFFGSIATMKLLDYKTKVNSMNQQEILEDLGEQIHINSMICNKKAKYYNKGMKFLMATIVIWFICMSFRLI